MRCRDAHLSAKIPNYRLRAAHEQPMFARTPVVTVRSSVDVRLKLWDEDRGCLVRYPRRGHARRQPTRHWPRAER